MIKNIGGENFGLNIGDSLRKRHEKIAPKQLKSAFYNNQLIRPQDGVHLEITKVA
jgi:hypothetical protein